MSIEQTSYGLTAWFTGLSGAGKTTLAERVCAALQVRGWNVELLDGDVVREELWSELGYTRKDREENVGRLARLARMLNRHGVITLVAAISPYRDVRDRIRSSMGNFFEIYVNAPIEVCEKRDVKGLYCKARCGELPDFTGVTAPYEPPLSPEVECRTDIETVGESVVRVMRAIELRLQQ